MEKKSTDSMPPAHPETAPLSGGIHPGPKMPSPALMQKSFTTPRVPWRLRIQVSGDSHTTIGMEVKDKILIGRHDPVSGNVPDLDLTPFGAEERGVSRHHAQIILYEGALYLEDLNSTNGTRLNGFRLESQNGYRLRDGDEIEAGQIRLVLRFIKAVPGK
jgi:hypothetical protein